MGSIYLMRINKDQLKIWVPIVLISLVAVVIFPLKQFTSIGFSKCGRVWNQVESAERLATYLLRSHSGSSEIEIDLKSTDYIFFELLPNDLKQIWTLGTNNPRCFSQTQRIYIQKIGEPEFVDSVAKEIIRSIQVDSSFKGTGAGKVSVRLGEYVPISQN